MTSVKILQMQPGVAEYGFSGIDSMKMLPSAFLRFSMAAIMLADVSFARATDPAVAGIIFQNACAQCHGAKGEGNAEIKSPSIASLPAWYVQGQLENFRTDRRGAHPQDAEGQIMRGISKVLNDEQVKALSEFVSKLPRVMPQPTIKADVTAGRQLYEERCMECHRFNGEGELVFGSSPLLGLPDWYLAGQLRKFRDRVRGALKEDVNGQKMSWAAQFIETEELLQSLAAYLMTLQQKKPSDSFDFGK